MRNCDDSAKTRVDCIMIHNKRTKMPYSPPSSTVLLMSCLSVALLTCGCLTTEQLPEQASIMERTEKDSDRDYYLYVPSTYSKKRSWPLVIACHGTRPYDKAYAQIREWAHFAEYNHIIVAAPKLVSSRGDFPPPADKQIALQKQDERAILGMVEEIKRRYRIEESQVFLTGWSAGAFPLLYTGLNNPNVFRAMFVRQGTFDAEFLPFAENELNPWQVTKVTYGASDFLRDQSIEMIEWLQEKNMFVQRQELPGGHRRIDPDQTWRFFADVIKERPWIRITLRAPDLSNPRLIQYHLDAVPPAVKQKWFFGDGESSYEASGQHLYPAPGEYEVTVNVALKGGKAYARNTTLRVFGTGRPNNAASTAKGGS